ncbi:recombinase family protein [Sphingomonas sp. IC4-52]|uniref:recombinase family protein n=1 Tax=Sphingomonas sp. IC4-52 TaxID=2887202 RepID=UPI001D0FF12E|nr:recombinase family protein [Sphingomonas sp. IC4-52]MCC2980810.1 recombinase family protein [Sphingomonas sp. IC4-52]
MTQAKIRCAIYTRKSSDEGLEQDFNSLDAQREACSAYIRSQAAQGWVELAERYDDGGFSGGTLDRPALKRLLGNVAARHIDVVLVYKVDRLSRSLFDFAKLVEAFEKAEASFASITQALNTTSSMGRLTLNMLLSFAQFEREITAERIRDKLAASKAKGMWMGGVSPLGYRAEGRSLEIIEEHAALVRHVFARYLALGSVRQLEAELKNGGVVAPRRTTASGKIMGGVPFTRGMLYLMLRRVVYTGRIAHRDKIYPGNHPAIVDDETFDRVQAMLADHRQGQPRTRKARPSLLAGKLVDQASQPLIATHATKTGANGKTVRYRYYVSEKLHHKRSDSGMRIPALNLEALVAERVATLFDDPMELVASAWLDVPAGRYADLQQRCAELAARQRRRQADALAMLSQIRVSGNRVEVICCSDAIAAALGVGAHPGRPTTVTVDAAVRLTRTGRAMQLVEEGGLTPGASPDASLVRMVMLARRWWQELRRGTMDITRLAEREKVSATYLTRVVRLAFLSPQVTEAILAGKQRAGVTGKMLTVGASIDPCWKKQAHALLPLKDDAGARPAGRPDAGCEPRCTRTHRVADDAGG